MASPLLGYNTNVRHHGKLFHIQTEDSGTAHAHVFTHLFADGGRIIASRKGSYAAWVGTERFPAVVKKLMQAQHKAMFIALRDGLFDVDEAQGARAFAAQSIEIEDGLVSVGAGASGAPSSPPPPSVVPPSTPEPSPRPASVDPAALERAAASLLAGSPSLAPPATPIAVPAPMGTSSSLPPEPNASRSGRYQTTRPASVRPRSTPPIAEFAADVLTDKSLDELIMSYLAEELDVPE